MAFAPGRVILHRNTRRGRLAFVRPARVVADDERGLRLWLARGTVSINEVTTDGRDTRAMPFAEWVTHRYELREGRWRGAGVLIFFPPGADHSVWFFRDDQDRFTNWYVNLEGRALRWDDDDDAGGAAGIDVVDHDLDIVVERDRTWAFKDEDELAERLAIPEHYWVPDEAAVWAEGRRVIKQIEAGDFPFDGAWTDFQPDSAWSEPPAMPDGWDRPPVERG